MAFNVIQSFDSVSARTPPHSNQKIYAQSHQQIHSNSDHSNSHQPPSHHTNQSHIPATTYATHQSRTNDIKLPKRPPTEQIYTRAADRNLHYQQQRMAEQHQYQHGGTAPNDGKNSALHKFVQFENNEEKNRQKKKLCPDISSRKYFSNRVHPF